MLENISNIDHLIPKATLVVSIVVLGLIPGLLFMPRILRTILGSRITSGPVISASRTLIVIPIALLFCHIAINAWPLGKELRLDLTVYLRVFAILAMGFAFMRLGSALFNAYTLNNEGTPGSASILLNLFRVGVCLIAGMIALEAVGISVTPALTALGVGGLAVALGFQETLSNLFGGLAILMGRKISVGDFIELEPGFDGRVEDIGWRTTSIRRLDGNVVVIPNATMAKSTILNFDVGNAETAILLQVGVAYNSDLALVERVTIEEARLAMEGMYGKNCFPEFEPLVRFHTFGDSSINFTVVMRARHTTDQHLLKHEFIKALTARYRQERIEIPFPIRTLARMQRSS
ncbi:MAG: mechanosensitive ion channel family protein [Leptospirales bacterium]|nr:mechanosensitive ion channel family protein [Leptospirales bacterium]